MIWCQDDTLPGSRFVTPHVFAAVSTRKELAVSTCLLFAIGVALFPCWSPASLPCTLTSKPLACCLVPPHTAGGRTSPHGLRNSQELRSSGMLSPGAITRSASPHGGHHHGYGAKAGSPTAGGGLQWRTGLSPQLLERACSPIVFPSDGSTPPGDNNEGR